MLYHLANILLSLLIRNSGMIECAVECRNVCRRKLPCGYLGLEQYVKFGIGAALRSEKKKVGQCPNHDNTRRGDFPTYSGSL